MGQAVKDRSLAGRAIGKQEVRGFPLLPSRLFLFRSAEGQAQVVVVQVGHDPLGHPLVQ